MAQFIRLSVAPLSIAYPIASLNFLGVTLASATILREKVGRPQWLGAWLVTLCEERTTGVFNAIRPGLPWEELLETCHDVSGP